MTTTWMGALLLLAVFEHRCEEDPGAVVVEARARKLHLCNKDGTPEATYRVSLGSGGLDKRKEGDRRTPVGRYPLGPPRPSRSGFDTFIPVGFPTPKQRAEGRTGSAIGIHGPPSGLPELASVLGVYLGNWTSGCIAVARVEDIRAIASWVRAHRVEEVVIDADA